MESLYHDLKLKGHSEHIFTTTVFPYAVATRQELMDALDLREPPMTIDYTAEKIVNGICGNERYIVIPNYYRFFSAMLNLLSSKNQDVFRKYVAREELALRK